MYAHYTSPDHSDHMLGAETGVLTARSRVNIRYGEPFRRAPARLMAHGTGLRYAARVEGENIEGNSRWFCLPGGEYCWSGAVNAPPG